MTGMIPFGGLSLTGQSTAQTLTTSLAQLTLTGASATATTKDRTGDPAVKPDASNSRFIVNAPGIYLLKADLSFTGNVANGTITFQARKAGSAVTGTKSIISTPPATTATVQMRYESIVEVTAADIPSSGGCQTFSDPSASAGAGKPAGGFAGAGAAPATGVLLDLGVLGNATQNMTLAEGRVLCMRIG